MCDSEKDITVNKETLKTNASCEHFEQAKSTASRFQMVDRKYPVHLDTTIHMIGRIIVRTGNQGLERSPIRALFRP